MEKAKTKIGDSKGLHLRNSAEVVRCAQRFESQITLCHRCKEAQACSILQVLTLHAKGGADVEIIANGPDEREAVISMAEVLSDGAGI